VEEYWNEAAIVPFWGREEQLNKLADLVRRCVETVTQSESQREMVLETWLILDYAVRDLVLSGYGLYKFSHEEFDLRYVLLPKSFGELLRLLEDTITFQSGLSNEPRLSHDYPPYMRSSYGFLKHLSANHGDIAEALKKIEAEYFAMQHPELAKQIEEGTKFYHMPASDRFEALPSGWLEVTSNLGDDWFCLARRLNKARNRAAHSHDSLAISKAFGIIGPSAIDLVRDECLRLLQKLLGITLDDDGISKGAKPG